MGNNYQKFIANAIRKDPHNVVKKTKYINLSGNQANQTEEGNYNSGFFKGLNKEFNKTVLGGPITNCGK
jgi:hypothetical protein